MQTGIACLEIFLQLRQLLLKTQHLFFEVKCFTLGLSALIRVRAEKLHDFTFNFLYPAHYGAFQRGLQICDFIESRITFLGLFFKHADDTRFYLMRLFG